MPHHHITELNTTENQTKEPLQVERTLGSFRDLNKLTQLTGEVGDKDRFSHTVPPQVRREGRRDARNIKQCDNSKEVFF